VTCLAGRVICLAGCASIVSCSELHASNRTSAAQYSTYFRLQVTLPRKTIASLEMLKFYYTRDFWKAGDGKRSWVTYDVLHQNVRCLTGVQKIAAARSQLHMPMTTYQHPINNTYICIILVRVSSTGRHTFCEIAAEPPVQVRQLQTRY
jgi:hypothetical protein